MTKDGLLVDDLVINFVKQFEGFSHSPYLCSGGFLTIGYGHRIRQGDEYNQYITNSEAEILLGEDLRVAALAVRRLIARSLNNYQRAALISFTYNLGSGSLQRSRLRRFINNYDDDEAYHEFVRWVWSGGRKLPGLVLRRQSERNLYVFAL